MNKEQSLAASSAKKTASSKKADSNEGKGDTPDENKLLPILPTRDIVPLPGLIIPILIGDGPAAKAVDHALKNGRLLVLALQTTESTEVTEETIEKLGTFARIVQSVKLPEGDLKVRLHVEGRVQINKVKTAKDYALAEVTYLKDNTDISLTKATLAKMDKIKENVELLADFEPALDDYVFACKDALHPGDLADLVGAAIALQVDDAIKVLEEQDPLKRLDLVSEKLHNRLELVSVREQISTKTNREITKVQREEILREHMRQIKLELGESHDQESEIKNLKDRLAKAKLPASANKEAERQIRKLSHLHPDTSEAALTRTYLEWILDIPWNYKTKDRLDLAKAKTILDDDHYGLEKAKERILDFLGVRKLKKNHRGPILLFVGPPGVGKTSLGRSIARSLGRKFVRVSLGGLRDEAELRGHRRTYVGALPGRIIQGLKRAGSRNPVFMLDELDKVGSDFRGDPASVLLEILDPEQNKSFEDHYLNIPYDLSEVMFIGTANVIDTIPAPLKDRLEIIELSGYTRFEKRNIAETYIVPREREENGLGKSELQISTEALDKIIGGYTRESGVRELSRVISTVYRKIARKVAEGEELPESIDTAIVEEALGPIVYQKDQRMLKDEVGVVTGLAWTSTGGETLMIEASITNGKGELFLTGQQGEVMRESAKAALTYVTANAERFGIDPRAFESLNVHIHLPQGAIPKDGPSAGIAITAAIVSVVSGVPVSHEVAMTGEVTLRGNVLAIGGLKEKALAAMRAGISTVIMPKDNERDLRDFPKHLIDAVSFKAVSKAEEVIELALTEEVPLRRGKLGRRKRSLGKTAVEPGRPEPAKPQGVIPPGQTPIKER